MQDRNRGPGIEDRLVDTQGGGVEDEMREQHRPMHIVRRRTWQPTPALWPGESHGQRSLVGYSPQGHKESDMNKVTEHAQACTPKTLTILFHLETT